MITSRRGANRLRTFASENLSYDFGWNTSTLSEFIGYADSTDFREISPERSRDNNDNNKPFLKQIIINRTVERRTFQLS